MASVVSPPKLTGETRILLHNISWATYERLLEDLQDASAPRLTYDRGVLEIMSPNAEHEDLNDSVRAFINILAEEHEIDFRGLGSTTFKREGIARGFEPDSCFYFQNEPLIRGKKRIDLTIDPPPDLVVEIDITSPSMDKFTIFAQLGIAEVWQYENGKLRFFRLAEGFYAESETSLILPFLTSEKASEFLNESLQVGRLKWLRGVRRWAREQRKS
jgi:Uma2 family endonuclease